MHHDTDRETEGADPWVRRDVRRARFDSLAHLWSLTALPRVRACRRTRQSIERGVSVVRGSDGASHMAGLQTCGSIHSCPVCAPAIRKVRADEIERACDQHLASGGGLLFLTLTLPHTFGDDLVPLLSLISAAYHYVVSGRRWAEDRADYGINGSIRSEEVTLGINGWHPHLHVLLFTDAPLDDDQVATLRNRLHGRWVRAVERTGRKAPNEHGTTLLRCETGSAVGRYLSKVYDEHGYGRHIGNEVARHDLKKGRRAGLNPFQLLEETRTGEASMLARWWEFERAMVGRRAIVWSRGLKARFAIEEIADEDALTVDVDPEAEEVPLTNAVFKILRTIAGKAWPALTTAHELHGAAGCYEAIDALLATTRDDPPPTGRAALNLQSDALVVR